MAKRKKHQKAGLPPATLIYTGGHYDTNPNVSIVAYNEHFFKLQAMQGLFCPKPKPQEYLWYDVRGLHSVKLVETIGQQFGMHPLAIEDVLNTRQRPKWEDYEKGIFIIVQALKFDTDAYVVQAEQVAFFLGTDFLITFQEDADELFEDVRQRFQRDGNKIAQKGVDFLAYSLIDGIVDNYFLVLDKTEEAIDAIENTILTDFQHDTRNQIYHLKRQLSDIKRAVSPLRDVASRFAREDSIFVNKTTIPFARDLYDHVTRVMENLESQKDMLINLHDLYNSELSNRANHVMKVLTIVSAIFIPLTFIVGVYGMNFDNMPELHVATGYFWVWIVMFIIAVLQLVYFRHKKWL